MSGWRTERGIWVISDECYVYLNYTGKQFLGRVLARVSRPLGGLGSLSKTYAMTGWRLGYALAPAAVTSAMQKLQSQSTSNPTSIVQKAAVAALQGIAGVRRRDAKRVHRVARSRGDRVALDSGREVHEAGRGVLRLSEYLIFSSDAEGVKSASDVAGKLLREAHVATVPGEGFGTHEHIRVSYATSMAELDRGLERMRKFFAGFIVH